MPNRLAGELSPYLLQHQHNPVDWYPWGPEALERARSEDRPIFLSIGYAACHWCHVMERESFEQPAIAALINREFVAIKVDREERPDLDQLYMGAVQALTGHGGWPMSVFLTPDLKPFFGGTYFPPTDRMGMPAFPRVLEQVAEVFHRRREEVDRTADEIARALGQALQAPGPLDRPALVRVASAIAGTFDPRHGGFGPAPKFPQPMLLEVLLRALSRAPDPRLTHVVRFTLDNMATGGLFDQLAGGFHRYSVDEQWLVPHFEKMLCDQALLARLYALAAVACDEPSYRAIATDTLDWVLRDMHSPEGGFYASLDADSEGVEGRYYVWTPQELAAVLGPERAARFGMHYGVSARGNFEGANVLHLTRTIADWATMRGARPDVVAAELAADRAELLHARAQRLPPALDDKVLAGWNGLMIRSLADAGRVLERPDYVAAAARTARFVLDRMVVNGRLMRVRRAGETRQPAFLDDHGALAEAFLALHQATQEPFWLERAQEVVAELDAWFWDEATGRYYDAPADATDLFMRPREIMDNAVPSGHSLALGAKLRLGLLTGDEAAKERAWKGLTELAELATTHTLGFGYYWCVADEAVGPVQEVAIAGDPGAPATRALWHEAERGYAPRRLVAVGRTGNGVAILADRPMVEGQATAYVCTDRACSAPCTTPEALRAALRAAG